MTRPLHLSIRRWNEASPEKKCISYLQRKINYLKKEITKINLKNKKRLEQARKDHNEIQELKLKLKGQIWHLN